MSVAVYSAWVVPQPARPTSSTGTRYGVVPDPSAGTSTGLGAGAGVGAQVGAHWARRRIGAAATIERNLDIGDRRYAEKASIEAIDAVGTALPVLVDLDPQGEERALGQLHAGPLADLLEHGATLADDHPLLALPLDDDLDGY